MVSVELLHTYLSPWVKAMARAVYKQGLHRVEPGNLGCGKGLFAPMSVIPMMMKEYSSDEDCTPLPPPPCLSYGLV